MTKPPSKSSGLETGEDFRKIEQKKFLETNSLNLHYDVAEALISVRMTEFLKKYTESFRKSGSKDYQKLNVFI